MKGIFQVCESIEQEGRVPEQWAKSNTISVYKGKGDVVMVDKHISETSGTGYECVQENPREEA